MPWLLALSLGIIREGEAGIVDVVIAAGAKEPVALEIGTKEVVISHNIFNRNHTTPSCRHSSSFRSNNFFRSRSSSQGRTCSSHSINNSSRSISTRGDENHKFARDAANPGLSLPVVPL